MKFRVALRNHRTQLHEIEHSVMSFTGVSRDHHSDAKS